MVESSSSVSSDEETSVSEEAGAAAPKAKAVAAKASTRPVPAAAPKGHPSRRGARRDVESSDSKCSRTRGRSPVRRERPRSPSATPARTAKGDSKGKKGKTDRQTCPFCWQSVQATQCSLDQHQYWSTNCLRWQRFRQGLSWESACAAAERMRTRRLARDAEPETRARASGSAAKPTREPSPKKSKAKKTDEKDEKKNKKRKARKASPSPDVRRRPRDKRGGGGDGSDSEGDGPQPKVVRHGPKSWLVTWT